jgi:hypothetical protein
MLRSFICSLLFATVTFAGTPKEFCTPAASDKDMNELAGQVSSAHERRPGDPAVLYYAAYVCAHSAQPEKAVVLLETMRSTGAGLRPRARDFESLVARDDYKQLLQKITKDAPPVLRAKRAFILPESDLVPEGIAWSRTTGNLYLGSVKKKIVSIDRKGNARDLVPSGSSDIGGVIGIRVDDERQELWAVSDSIPGVEGGKRGVFRFRLSDGKQLAHYPVGDEYQLLNDVAIAPNGIAYMTVSVTGAVLRIDPSKGTVERFVDIPDANGITITPDGKYAFVASWYAVYRMDLETKHMQILNKPRNVADGCFDGLYLKGQSLIGVQNCIHDPGRILQLRLNASLDSIKDAIVLVSDDPAFDGITTAAPADNGEVYFVANPQFRKWKKQPLKPLVVMKVKMKE